MKFEATAEHTAGASISHPCSKGSWNDPVDHWQPDIDAPSLDAARKLAHNDLADIVDTFPKCDCRRKEQPGSNRWWNSVIISLWPKDAAAYAEWIADGGDPAYDPYKLIPASLKPSDEEGE